MGNMTDIMNNLSYITDGVTGNMMVLGFYVLFDNVYPMLINNLTAFAPALQGPISAVSSDVSFLTKQVAFHIFGKAGIKTMLGLAA